MKSFLAVIVILGALIPALAQDCSTYPARIKHCRAHAAKLMDGGGWTGVEGTLQTASGMTSKTGAHPEVYNCTYFGDVQYADGRVATQAGFAQFETQTCKLVNGGGSVETDRP